MPSNSWIRWNTERAAALDQIENAHMSVGGSGPGRRFAVEQINHAYAILLSSQFQGFCRDLHAESVDHFVAPLPANLRMIHYPQFRWGRMLDRGNPNPGNIGTDFNRFGLSFWQRVMAHDPRNVRGQAMLERLSHWRNAIAHQDFDLVRLGGNTLHLATVRTWRRALNRLARSFDDVMQSYLQVVLGSRLSAQDRGNILSKGDTMAESRKFTVGQTIRFRFGIDTFTGTIKEDLGPIGVKGRRIYTIAFTPDSTPEMIIELPGDYIELVPEEKSAKQK